MIRYNNKRVFKPKMKWTLGKCTATQNTSQQKKDVNIIRQMEGEQIWKENNNGFSTAGGLD